ncbi:hypothetical protein NDU88_006753 [Pleurodeles waltl]|uniref:Uncharacterized protein n=1 Tax=Pleurodeles waltl TaxID=8319 RepID=A0AAV7N0C4_PLEWA|nr:hypothetical protein NDU88_006753 [Pleurodeles waltl]
MQGHFSFEQTLAAVSCHLVNTGSFIAQESQEGEESHDCMTYIPKRIRQADEDPILDSEALFIDGSSMIDQETGLRRMGAAVVMAHSHTHLERLQGIVQLTILLHLSKQAAELTALY